MNKLQWFTHDNDALEDEFIQGLMDRFGHFGYAGYFMLIELLDRHGTGDSCTMKLSRVAQKLRSKPAAVRQLVAMCRDAGKMAAAASGDDLTWEIPKFRKRQSKMKSKVRSKFSQSSPNVPLDIEGEVEGEKKRHTGGLRPAAKAAPGPETPLQTFLNRFLSECLNIAAPAKDAPGRAIVTAAYRRYGRAAKDVLAMAGGDPAEAMRGVMAIGSHLQQKNLTWTLDTVAKHFLDWKQGGFNGGFNGTGK